MSYLTDRELLQRFEYYTLQLERHLGKKGEFSELIDAMPFPVLVSRPNEIRILQTNRAHEAYTGYALDQVREDCQGYLQDIVLPASLENVRRFLPPFYAQPATCRTMAFIQYVQLFGGKEYLPLVTVTKAPVSGGQPVVRLCLQPGEFGRMSVKMERIVEMDRFKLRHFKRFQRLTKREIQVLKLLASGYSNPDIADQLCLSRQTVETHRKKLKAKLELGSFFDLMKYAFAFDLVNP